jgi:hypothetical protein
MPVIPSENPLQVFVSSVMSDEMSSARQVCFDVVSQLPWRPWLFERTPAAPVDSTSIYLDAVRNSDVVVWLVGARTTQAVADEIGQAIASGKPILGLRLPVADRDELTNELWATVRSIAKTQDVDGAAIDEQLINLELHLRLALSDMLVRQFRQDRRVDAGVLLRATRVELRGVAIARWQATGVAVSKAVELFDRPQIGNVDPSLEPTDEEPFRVLAGDVGSGKSLGAIRYLVRQIEAWLADTNRPIPTWVAAQTRETISQAVDRVADIGDVRRNGAIVVVDGADEGGPDAFQAHVDDARRLVQMHPSTRVLLTARPGSTDGLPAAVVTRMPLLDELGSIELINTAFGLDLGASVSQSWAPTIRDAVRRPLFALLLGRHLETRASLQVGSPGQLVEELVTGALGRVAIEGGEADEFLMRLAVRSIDREGFSVAMTDLGPRYELASLLRTRLVTRLDDSVTFSLPILREWFGARSIDAGLVARDHVARDERQLERWRYPIVIALAISSRDTVDSLLAAMAEVSPGFAGQVIDESVRRWRSADQTALPSAEDLGTSYRRAMGAFIAGAGPLGPLLAPTGTVPLPRLGVRLQGETFIGAWSTRQWPDDVPEIHSLTMGEHDGPEWSWRLISQAAPDAVWPWRRTLDELRTALAGVVNHRRVFVEPMSEEAVWMAALELAHIGDHWYRPIDRAVVMDRINQIPNSEIVEHRRVLVPLAPLRAALATAAGPLICPYPDRDAEMGGLIWSGFRPATLLSRTELVLNRAVSIYTALVRDFFPSFAARLYPAALSPFGMVARITPRNPAEGPTLSYYFKPLPDEEPNGVSVTLAEDELEWNTVDELAVETRALRPDLPWLGARVTHSMADVFGADPATTMAFKWLRQGLVRLKWLDRLTWP